MTTKLGSPPWPAMFALVHASARLTSTMWSGHVALRRQSVVGGDADPAPLGEVGHQRLGLAFLLAHRPGTAVDLEQHGRSGVGREVAALPHVELVAHAEVPVADVARRTGTAAAAASRAPPVAGWSAPPRAGV